MRGTDWLIAGALFIVALLPFAGLSEHELVLDAQRVVGGNSEVIESDWSELARSSWWPVDETASSGFRSTLYRPLTLMWFAAFFDGPDDAGTLAMANAALHGLGTALRFLLVLMLFRGRSWRRFLAVGAALFPAVHALSGEGVLGHVGAAEILVHVFVLVSWLVFTMGLDRRGAPRLLAFALAALAWGAAAFSKESALTFPLVLFVHALFFAPAETSEQRNEEAPPWAFGTALIAMLPFLAVLAGVWASRVAVLGEFAPFDVSGVYRGFTVTDRIASAFAVQGNYALHFFWPFDLAPIITHDVVRPPASFFEAGVLAGVAIWFLGAAGILVALARRCPAGLFGLAAGLAMLPASNLLIGIGAVGGYRFVYGPLAFVVVALGAAIALIGEKRPGWAKGLIALATVLGLVGLVGLRREVKIWATPDSISRHAYEVSPQDPHALSNYVVRFHAEKLRGDDRAAVDRAVVAHEAFAEIEADLARIPGTKRLPEQTRILATRHLSNHAQMLTLRSTLSGDDPASQDRDINEALDQIARAEAYAVGRPADRMACRMKAIEIRLASLATASQARRLDEATRMLAQEELRVAVGETKLYVQAHEDELPEAIRLNYHFESARFASLEKHPELVVARLRRIFEIDPFHNLARGLEADLLIRRRQYRLALTQLERVIDGGRPSVSIFARAADLASRTGDDPKRLRYLQGVLSQPAQSLEEARFQSMAAQQLQAAGLPMRSR